MMDYLSKEYLDEKLYIPNNIDRFDAVHLERTTILNEPSLVHEGRIRTNDSNIKILETRESDDGSIYHCQVCDGILVNYASSFIVSKDSYNILLNRDDNREKDYIKIDLNDDSVNYEDSGITVDLLKRRTPVKFI